MKNNSQKNSFLGSGWNFPPTFVKGPQGLAMVSAEEDIRQSLEILLTTSVGERFLRPTYGCDLKKYVFEPLDAGMVAYIKDLVNTAILYHEPRIRMLDLKLAKDQAEGRLLITVEYIIRSTNTRSNYVFPFYQDEGTDIKK